MTERTLHQFTLSPYSIKVRCVLAFKGLPYGTVEVNPFARGPIRRLSGQTRVPVLVESEASGAKRVIADSTAIALHLDRTAPGPRVYPEDAVERARILALEDWSDEAFAADFIPFKIFRGDNARRMTRQSRPFYPRRWYYELLFPLGPVLLRRLSVGRRRGRTDGQLLRIYEDRLDLLDVMASGGAFLSGEQPTIFDFSVWALLRTLEGLNGEELLARRGALASWYGRVKTLVGDARCGG